MKAKIYQTTGGFNDEYFKMCKEISPSLPFYGVLEGTLYSYIIAIPSSIDPSDIFKKYGVKTLESYEIEFDDDKFNENYQLTTSYVDGNYVLQKPFKYCSSYNGIRINEDGYPIDEDNKVIPDSKKFYPTRHGFGLRS